MEPVTGPTVPDESVPLDLDAIEARAAAATAGPWKAYALSVADIWRGNTNAQWFVGDTQANLAKVDHPTDAVFIAHAREDVPALIAEVRHLAPAAAAVDPTDTEIARLRAEIETANQQADDAVRKAFGLKADWDAARVERDRLRAALKEIRSVGARSGTNLNAMNDVFDIANAALREAAS